MTGKQHPNSQFIEKFLIAFPDINARWLITGEGDMTLEEPRAQYGF
jgi:hypothetical protein